MIDTEELPPPSLAVKLGDFVTYSALCRLHAIGKSVKPSKWSDISLLAHQSAAACAREHHRTGAGTAAGVANDWRCRQSLYFSIRQIYGKNSTKRKRACRRCHTSTGLHRIIFN